MEEKGRLVRPILANVHRRRTLVLGLASSESSNRRRFGWANLFRMRLVQPAPENSQHPTRSVVLNDGMRPELSANRVDADDSVSPEETASLAAHLEQRVAERTAKLQETIT